MQNSCFKCFTYNVNISFCFIFKNNLLKIKRIILLVIKYYCVLQVSCYLSNLLLKINNYYGFQKVLVLVKVMCINNISQ